MSNRRFFGAMALVIILSALATVAFSADLEFCSASGDYAAAAMESRLAGVPPTELMKGLREGDNPFTGADLEHADFIIKKAYAAPLYAYPTGIRPEDATRIVNRFRSEYETWCLGH